MSGSEGDGSDELDVLSDSFNALSALYSDNVILPWKKAPAFDNVAKYEALAGKSDGSVSLDKVRLCCDFTHSFVFTHRKSVLRY